ncbi:Putative high mobility group protein [Oxytricha trifallax]|uniref:Putative high mobility group protein n=1 Tax=Oxytricha trifallax TaxID=1172189 RepID=A0A073I0Q2_9SPIT|nr:Putative high mobility group protein [Oxytricha trifallax]
MQTKMMQNQMPQGYMPHFQPQSMQFMPMMPMPPQQPMQMPNVSQMFNMMQSNPAMKDHFNQLCQNYQQSQNSQPQEKVKDSIQKTKSVPDVKKPTNAYIFFQKEEMRQLMSDNPGNSVASFAKQVGLKWAGLTSEEKSKFEQMAENDKIRYQREIQENKQSVGVSNTKKGKSQKTNESGEKQVKKSRYTSYLIFNMERMIELKKENPKIMPPELTKITSQEWKAMSDEQKLHYKKLAEEKNNRVQQ